MSNWIRGALPRPPRIELVRLNLEKRLSAWSPLTIVRGPQGYGKTTLVAGWLSRQNPESVLPIWINVTSDLASRAQFLSHLGYLAVLAGAIPATAAEPAPTLLALSRALLELPADRRLALVLDNAHLLADESLIEDLVSMARRHENLHIVVCGRSPHRFTAIASHSLNVNTIWPEELLLSTEEIGQLGAQFGRPIGPEDADALRHAVSGWFSAILIALAATARNGPAPLAAVEQYLRDTVLPGIADQATLILLMRCALTDGTDSRLMPLITGAEGVEGERALDAMESTGLLRWLHHEDGTTMVLPALVKKILREAYRDRAPEAALALHRALSRWYATTPGKDHSILALEHAVAGRSWDAADDLWAEHGLLLTESRLERLKAALETIPEEVLVKYPGMHVSLATLRIRTVDDAVDVWTATAQTYVEASERAIAVQSRTLKLPDLLYLGTGHLIGLRQAGRLDSAAGFAHRLVDRVNALSKTGHRYQQRLGWLFLQLGLLRTLMDNGDEAIRCYQRAWGLRSSGPEDFVAAGAASAMALTYALRPDPVAARLWLDRHADYSDAAKDSPYLADFAAHIARGLLALDQLDAAAVRTELGRLGDGRAPVALWAFAAYLRAQYGLHFASPAATAVELDCVRAAHPAEQNRQGAAAVLLNRSAADLLLANRQQPRAHAQPNAAEVLGGTAAVYAIAQARTALLAGDNAAARRATSTICSTTSISARERLEAVLLDAVASLRMGDLVSAGQLAGQAMDIYRRTGNLRAFTTIPVLDRERLQELAGQGFSARDRAALDAALPVYPDHIVSVSLSRSEILLVEALASGRSRHAIAEHLHVSLNTVKSNLGRLYRKLGTNTRGDTLEELSRLGLLP